MWEDVRGGAWLCAGLVTELILRLPLAQGHNMLANGKMAGVLLSRPNCVWDRSISAHGLHGRHPVPGNFMLLWLALLKVPLHGMHQTPKPRAFFHCAFFGAPWHCRPAVAEILTLFLPCTVCGSFACASFAWNASDPSKLHA
eukprot:scaffold291550_cov15-Tisochrysis_lutea.AAC.1